MAFISMLFALGVMFFVVYVVFLAVGSACLTLAVLFGTQYREGAALAKEDGRKKETWKLVTTIICGVIAAGTLGFIFWLHATMAIAVVMA